MALNPKSQQDMGRLQEAVKQADRDMGQFRERRKQSVDQYVGSRYAENGPDRAVPLNLIAQVVDMLMVTLASNRPRVLVDTAHQELKPFATRFQESTNRLLKDIRFEKILQRAVLDAAFSLGIVKTYMADAGAQWINNEWIDPGKPFATNLSLDYFCYDTAADEWEEIRFASDRYQVDFAALRDPLFDQDVVKRLGPSPPDAEVSKETEKVGEITRGDDHGREPLIPSIWLRDVWLPGENLLLTFADDKSLLPLVTREENQNPYHRLAFHDVPDNAMPRSVVGDIAELHGLANSIVRKMGAMGRSRRNVHAYEPGAEEDAKRLKRSGHNEWVSVNSIDRIKTFTIGEIDQGLLALLQQIIDLSDRMSGNLRHAAGLGAEAETLGQEEMIGARVNQRLAKMLYKTTAFAVEIIKALGWMLWDDQATTIPARMKIGGTDLSVDRSWRPGHREGNFLDYNFDIAVHSMPYKSPVQRVQQVNYLLTSIIPALAQMGGLVDLPTAIDFYAELLDEPRLHDLLRTQPTQEQQPPGGQPPRQSPHTVRENVRHNAGGQDQGNRLVEQFVRGGGQQTAETAV
jgi:hypothetical protein